MSVEELTEKAKQLNEQRQRIVDSWIKREANLKAQISQLEKQRGPAEEYSAALDRTIKQLSLIHSQVSAIGKYKLPKKELDEILSFVSSI